MRVLSEQNGTDQSEAHPAVADSFSKWLDIL